jgi:hypothetical protein
MTKTYRLVDYRVGLAEVMVRCPVFGLAWAYKPGADAEVALFSMDEAIEVIREAAEAGCDTSEIRIEVAA